MLRWLCACAVRVRVRVSAGLCGYVRMRVHLRSCVFPSVRSGVRVCCVGANGRARSAAGVTWTSRTPSAPWAARFSHTSVIDAAGAIYVIGGAGLRGTYYHDVWASTDGGARPELVGRGIGLRGCHGDLDDTPRSRQGTRGVLWRTRHSGCSRGTLGVLEGNLGVPRVGTTGA